MNNKNLIYLFLAVFMLWGVSLASGSFIFGFANNSLVNGTQNFTIFLNTAGNSTDANSTACVEVDYSTDRGVTWNVLGKTTNNTADEAWYKMNATGFTYYIRNATSAMSADGTVLLNVTCWKTETCTAPINGTNDTASGGIKTLRIDNTAPVVTLVNPPNGTWNSSGSISFWYSVAETNPLTCNISINGAKTDAYPSNSSAIVSGTTYNLTRITIADSNSIYVWNIKCLDSQKFWTYATANRSFFADATAPTGAIINMPKITNIYAQNPIKISCSGTDANALSYIKLTITAPNGDTTDYTAGSSEELTLKGTATGHAGTNKIDCKVYDKAGNSYSASQQTFDVRYRAVHAAAEEVAPEEVPEETTPTTPSEGAGEEVEIEEPSSKAWIWVVVIVVIVGILYFVLRKKK